ncbi:uncharacterized protein LOC122980400 isoform X1 [Thunnus albacares]|uniref:uncharacterized protein LOC121893714 isoform X1 n=1 Tax=Thunnus maccoyii TaxID=8240 RepID=UPI001C4D4EAC|nr:uncharacterized protein LOC121893714 isoform X1 [Thunnus maccoyii]XP_044204296.1 uncharacterized protein LOC122980400 isoform X1 [Thunnus albacares]
MSNTRFQHFRGFLTERFTTVAVEIFEEVESIVEEFREENKRLQNLLHMVLNPEIKLPRIDVSKYTVTTGGREQPPQLNTDVDPEISEPLPKKPKEEEIECDVSWALEPREGPREANNSITTDCVKNDPDEENLNMPCIAESFQIKVMEHNPDSSATLSANDEVEEFLGDSEVASDCQQLSISEESTNEDLGPEKKKSSKKKKKLKRSLQRTVLEFPRMMPYKTFIAAPTDCQSFLARLTEAYKDIPDDKKPLITKMGLTEDVELVDCAFGKVPKGCPLSYQCPVPSSQDYKTHDDAPPRPLLPLPYHRLEQILSLPTLSAREQEHINVMEITWEGAHSLEYATREHRESIEDLRKLRLTTRFREICKLKPGPSHAEHLIFKIQKGFSRCKTAQIEEEMKTEALREYCQYLCVNWSPCGLVVHPNAPWLGALPDGLVYDPNEKPCYGLVHVKCTSFRSFIDCSFLNCKAGVLNLKKTNSCYWHMQGEMMVTGTSWCDLLVFSVEDILVQRIYRDNATIKLMKRKLDDFFFYYYLPSLFDNNSQH